MTKLCIKISELVRQEPSIDAGPPLSLQALAATSSSVPRARLLRHVCGRVASILAVWASSSIAKWTSNFSLSVCSSVAHDTAVSRMFWLFDVSF